MQTNSHKGKPKLSVTLGWIALAVILGTFSYRYINPTARAGRATLANLADQDIVSISIEPAKYASMVDAPVVIRDKQSLSALAKALSNMPGHLPDHPKINRSVVLRIRLKDRVIGGELDGSSNDGTTFYYMSDVGTGWVFGTYLVPPNRDIFRLIKQLLGSDSMSSISSKRTRVPRAA
jgi:hypothetical protein